jgi:hypothetical protein
MEMIKLLNIYLNHFPKHEKYALALQIRQTAYHIYDLITECHKKYYKKTTASLFGHAKATATIPYYQNILREEEPCTGT